MNSTSLTGVNGIADFVPNMMSIKSCKYVPVLLLLCIFLCLGCQRVENPIAIVDPPVGSIQNEASALLEAEGQEGLQLTKQEIQTLGSLELLDEYPLYSLRYYGGYPSPTEQIGRMDLDRGYGERRFNNPALQTFGCSLFAAFGDPESFLYGRNFDWRFSPAAILYTDPPDGFASFTMVDLEYLVEIDDARHLHDLELDELDALLETPYWPFDGMNEHGLVIGMAAVPESSLPFNPAQPTIGSLGIMRQILDQAQTVQEAIAIFETYNLDMLGGPWLHYLVADASGKSALIEFYDGEMLVFQNQQEWQGATNFLSTTHPTSLSGICPRYDKISQRLSSADGTLDPEQAFALLEDVSQAGQESGTQWSVVYDLSHREVLIVMGKNYTHVHRLTFDSFSD